MLAKRLEIGDKIILESETVQITSLSNRGDAVLLSAVTIDGLFEGETTSFMFPENKDVRLLSEVSYSIEFEF